MFQASDITHGESLRGLFKRRKGDPVSGWFLAQWRNLSPCGIRGELNKVRWKYLGVAEVCFSSLISSSLFPVLLSILRSPEGPRCNPSSFPQGFVSLPGWECPGWVPLSSSSLPAPHFWRELTPHREEGPLRPPSLSPPVPLSHQPEILPPVQKSPIPPRMQTSP